MEQRRTTFDLGRVSSLVARALCVSAALMIPVSMVSELQFASAAEAKNGNGGGNGNGNGGNKSGGSDNGKGGGSGHGKSGGSDNGKGGSAGKSGNGQGQGKSGGSDKAKKQDRASGSSRSKGNSPMSDALGVPASELGALNGAKASPAALANAAPNSRVGRLAAYRTAVLNGNAIEEDYARALATLDGLDEPARSVADIDAAIGVATGDLAQAEADRAVLEAELEAAGGSDSAIEAEIAAKTGEINQLAAEIGTLEDERADAANYEEAAEAVALLDDQLTEQQDLERSLLDAAANKPVTDAVVAQVNALLGLE